jgi:hypothetical protein
LEPTPYLELPLGSIKANGWLEDQLQRMANGLTGHLDEIYPEVVEREWNGDYSWNLENAPIALKLQGVHLPEWRTIKSAPQLSEKIPQVISTVELERRKRTITLLPYGCTTLRITEFPVVRVE